MILIAIVDNNQLEGQALEECVENCLKEKGVAYMLHKYDNGVEFIRSRTNYDIVFMDIQLGDMDGVDAAYFLRIVNKDAKLIFVTHLAERAIEGYKVDAIDFILKPADQSAIDYALNKALKSIGEHRQDYFPLKTSDGVISLSTSSIYYVEVYDHDLIYHTEQGDYKVRGRLSDVRERLDDRVFIQCSRSYLVNIRHVKSVHSDHLVINGTKIQIVKSHHKKIEQTFIDSIGKTPDRSIYNR